MPRPKEHPIPEELKNFICPDTDDMRCMGKNCTYAFDLEEMECPISPYATFIIQKYEILEKSKSEV